MEIAPGVHCITLGGGEEGGPPSTHAYYAQGSERGVFIDAGLPEEDRTKPLIDYWRDTLGAPQTDAILVTHRHHEHAGGARLLKDATGARVAVGRGDAQAIDADFGGGNPLVDQPLDGDETFPLGGNRLVRVIATPGHTEGTVCFLLEPDGILFTGDHIMGQGSVVIRTDQGGSMAQQIESMRRLLDLNVTTILSGHGPAISEDISQRINDLIRHRQEREEQVLDLLREGVNNVESILARIYSGTPERLLGLARHQIVAHLHKLVEEGRIVASDDDAYRLV